LRVGDGEEAYCQVAAAGGAARAGGLGAAGDLDGGGEVAGGGEVSKDGFLSRGDDGLDGGVEGGAGEG
jgi:hypothetical protein